MEFYAYARVDMSAIAIQRAIHISNLAELCDSINKVLSHEGERGDIYCVWGEFKVHREIIRRGVRFSLPGCPNTFQWTVSNAIDNPGYVRIHATIDRPRHDPDFIESLQHFVDDWKQGLESGKAGMFKSTAGPAGECLPIYG